MNKHYEVRLFSELPKNLRNKVVDLDGERVEPVNNLLPDSRIIIETSRNMGVIPYLLKPCETFFNFFKLKAEEAGTTPDEISERLCKSFQCDKKH